MRAADTGISIGWRWIQILTTIASAFFVAGVVYAGFNAMEDELVVLSAKVSKLQDSHTETDKQIALLQQNNQRNTDDVKRIDGTLIAMIGQITSVQQEQGSQNKMREAYEVKRAGQNRVPSQP